MLTTLFRVRNIRKRGSLRFFLKCARSSNARLFLFLTLWAWKETEFTTMLQSLFRPPAYPPHPQYFPVGPYTWTITYLSAFDSLKLGKALYLSNSLTASKCPDAQLQCSAVIPSLSWWSTSAPCSINTVINFTNPPWAAHCSGVRLQNTQTNRYARAL